MSKWNAKGIWEHDSNAKAFLLLKNDNRFLKHKLFVELLYTEYEKYCPDPEFDKKLIQDWDGMIWQMYLTIFLCRKGYKLEKAKGNEPDIMINSGNKKIWIECISITKGEIPNAPEEIPVGRVVDPNDEKICLRLTSGICEKYNQYQNRIQNKVIDLGDPYIIALSMAALLDSMTELDATYLKRVLFGLGRESCCIKSSEEGIYNDFIDVEYEKRNEIKKKNNSIIEGNIFQLTQYNSITGILLTTADPIYFCGFNSNKMYFYHNPLAKNKIPSDYFQFGTVGYCLNDSLEEKVYEL